MERKSKTRITIETDRVFVISKRKTPPQGWCLDCPQPTRMVTPDEVVKGTGLTSRAVFQAIEAGTVHFSESADGLALICLNSLLSLRKTPATEETWENCLKISPRVPSSSSKQNLEQKLELLLLDRMSRPTSPVTIGEESRQALAHQRKAWNLTPEALDSLLCSLNHNRDRAAEKYEDIRRRLIKYFECRRCQFPEDQADETINRVARKISDGCEIWTSDPASYFYGVARYVLKEYWSSPDRDFLPLDSLTTVAHTAGQPPSIDSLQSERSMESRLQALDHCIQELSPEDRDALLQYYQGEKGDKVRNRKNLARQLAIPVNALRIKVHRIRKRLEAEVNEYLAQQD